MIKRNTNKRRIFGDLRGIKKGDVVFTDCDGPCSGGALYDIGEEVLKVTKDTIVTDNSKYSKTTGWAVTEPFAYYISFWQEGK